MKFLPILIALVAQDAGTEDHGLFLPEPGASAVEPSTAQPDVSPLAPAVPDVLDWGGATVRSRRVKVDFDRLGAAASDPAASSLRLNLFEDTVFSAVALSVSPSSAGYVLTGDLDGVSVGQVTLAVDGDTVVGVVRTGSATYTLSSQPHGAVLIREVDPSTLPPEAEPIRLPQSPGPPPAGDGFSDPPLRMDLAQTTGGSSRIVILVVYTQGARNYLTNQGSTLGATTTLLQAETNKALKDSGVKIVVRLKQARVTYTEASTTAGTTGGLVDLIRLQVADDGYMDEVHRLRAQHDADFVHLISVSSGVCGIAYLPAAPSYAQSFALTSASCLPRGTFTHELGHNLGLAHDRFVTRDGGSASYARGYVNLAAFAPGAESEQRWYTMMAYSSLCQAQGESCSRLLRYSNPKHTHEGDPLGIPGDDASALVTGPADAARALNDVRVAAASMDPRPVFLERFGPQVWVRNQAVSLTLPEAVGADGPLTYSLSPTLPVGVTRTDRTITGTPTGTESKTYVWRATDADGDSVQVSFGISVMSAAGPSFGTARIDDLYLSSGFAIPTVTLPAASGGTAPLTYSLSPALPSGLTYAHTAQEGHTIKGTPSGDVSTWYTWKAEDKNGAAATLKFRIRLWPLQIRINGGYGVEGDQVTFRASLSGTAPRRLEFLWDASVESSDSADGNLVTGDFWRVSGGRLDFSEGAFSQILRQVIRDDDIVEEAETFTATIRQSNLPAGVTVRHGSAQGVIADYDETTLQVGNAQAAEGKKVKFRARLGKKVSSQIVLNASTGDDVAVAPDDFVRRNKARFRIRAGARSAVFSVAALADSDAEQAETFKLRLSPRALPRGVRLATTEVTGTILDRTPRGASLSHSTLTVLEGNSANYKVALISRPMAPVQVTMSTDLSATDLSVDPTTLTFQGADWNVPRAFQVTAAEDSDLETDSPVVLKHSVAGTGYSVATEYEVRVLIAENDVATLSVGDARASESSGKMTFSVALSESSIGVVAVDYATSDGTGSGAARAGDDYTATSGTVRFPPGTTTAQKLSVAIMHDVMDEKETETFVLTLSNPRNASLAGGAQTLDAAGMIEDDDDPSVIVSFGAPSYEVTEGGSVPVTMRLSADPERTVEIPLVRTHHGGATDSDYSGVPSSVTFLRGETEQRFTFTALDDSESDDGESVVLSLGTLPSRVNGSGETTLAIQNDDDPSVLVSFGAPSYEVTEGGSIQVTMRLSADVERTVVIPLVRTHNDGATDADYSGVPSSVTFLRGETEKLFTFTAIDDSADDDGESVVLSFGSLPPPVEGSGRTTVAIRDNDDSGGGGGGPPPRSTPPPPVVSVSAAEAPESAGAVVFEVHLSGASGSVATVDYATSDGHGAGGARAGSDYTVTAGTLTFPAGSILQRIQVPVKDDGQYEPSPESFVLTLQRPVNATLAGGGSALRVTGTIHDDDDSPPTAAFEIKGATCGEELCRALTGVPAEFVDTSTGKVLSLLWEFGDGAASRSPRVEHAWSAPGYYEVTLSVSDSVTTSTASRVFLVEASQLQGRCIADAQTLCLQNSRYAVTVEWRKADGARGAGSVVYRGTNDSGLFTFFDRETWEVLVKVLDGCAVNGHMWVYGSSMTDLGYSIRVTDTITGTVREYRNEPGQRAPAITDTTVFPDGCAP